MEATAQIELDGQYRELREGAGFLERASRDVLAVRGAEAAEYLQGQLTNEIEALSPGEGCYAALLDRKGRLRGDMRVLRRAPDALWIELEAIATPAVSRHLQMYKVGREVEIEDRSEGTTVVSVIGPAAAEVTSAPSGTEHSHRELRVGGVEARAVTTDVGIDLIVARDDTAALSEALIAAGAAEVGEPAAEVVRVESGRPRFGFEMTTATMPQEAGINDRAVSFTKGCYIGQETVARLHYRGKPNRHLRGLRLEGQVAGGEPITLGEREVGSVGTAVLSPALGAIGLAIVRREAEPGATVDVGENATAEVAELPF